ncbi:MAG: NnrS family protein [Caulobacter sp.]|nr:NnrS family protein [Caulobacter sp.]
MTSAAARRQYSGPALFSFGFRPFFLGAAVWAVLAVPLWLWAHLGGSTGALIDRDWHVHEMLFGYVGGVIAGFLLTAVPNWTGRLPVTGAPLAALAGLWLAGRAAMLLAPAQAAGVLTDGTFLVVFAAVIWREVLAGRNWRNLPVAVIVTLLATANLGFHARLLWPEVGPMAERGAVGMIAMLIAFIGGRVVPSFTRNWMVQVGRTPLPAKADWVDQAGVVLVATGVAAWIAAPEHRLTGIGLCLGGLATLFRLSRWRTGRVLFEPLVWVLHAGYAWLGLGLILAGAHVLDPAAFPRTAGLHALMTGAAGVMTLAMMTRATLGHTGRERFADRATVALFLAANLAAAVRLAAAFILDAREPLLIASACLWSAAFGLFVLRYGPMLVRPRLGG